MWEERYKLLCQKEPGLYDLGNSQLIQIVKDVKIKRFILIKECSSEKTGCGWIAYANQNVRVFSSLLRD